MSAVETPNDPSIVAAGASSPAPGPQILPGGAVATPGAGAQRPMSASLYVGDLDPDVGESLLFDIFKQVGPVASIRVCRDAVTRRSLGYAYVNFHSVSDAERALDTLNYSSIKGAPCRIMWSHRDPSIRKSGVGNIFIKNLDKSIDNKALYDTFSTFGNILSCKVEMDEHNQSKGYGFVHYETQKAADNAIASLNNMLLNDYQVYVGSFIPRKDRKPVNPSDTYTNVYVKNLDEAWDDAKLREIFGRFGPISSAVVMRDQEGKSRGFGFVNFENHPSALAAVENVNQEKVGDKVLFADRAQKKAERDAKLRDKYQKLREKRMQTYQGVNLYIKNLDDSIDEERLRTEFAAFGTITSAKIMVDDKGTSRGFGFVCYSKPEEATKAVNEMNSKMISNKPIYVALAQPKEVRRAQLEASYSQRQNLRMQQAVPMGGVPPMYGGAPVFYPQASIPGAGGRQPYVYPQGMIPPAAAAAAAAQTRRWTGQPGAAGGRPQSFAPAPNFAIGGPNQRQPRQGGARGGSSSGGRGGANIPVGQVGGANIQGSRAPGASGAARRGGGNVGKYHNAGLPAGGRRPDGMIPAGAPAPLPQEMVPTADSLTHRLGASPEERKQLLGDNLFPLIHAQQPQYAAKLTGMILESTDDLGELLHLLEDSAALNEKVTEAFAVLSEHLKNAPAAAEGAAPAAAEGSAE